MKTETISYEELARRVGDMILANHLPNEIDDNWMYGLIEQPLMRKHLDDFDRDNGVSDDDEDAERSTVYDREIYQTYIITERGAEYLFNYTAELISYSEKLDLWFWHIGHWGTAWSGVHTTVYEVADYDNYISGEAMLKYAIG